LTGAEVQLTECFAFPDHYRYKPADLAQLLRSTRKAEANLLITTEKDIVRLPAEVQPSIATMPVELDFGTDEALLRKYLCNTLHI
jgi:tetraacyldisaccharide 4'-kinase